MIRTTRRIAGVCHLPTAALLLTVLVGILWAGPARAQEADNVGFVPGEVVVKLVVNSNGTTDCRDAIEKVRASERATIEGRLVENPRVACIYLLQLPQGSDAEAAAQRIAADSARVAYAEPNFTADAPEGNPRHRAAGDSTPQPSSESGYDSQYAREKMGLPNAHGKSKGDGAVVAVLDTGVQPDHPALQGSLVPGYDFVGDPPNTSDDPIPADEPNTVDEDGDGFTDEMVGHGTHVAGIVHLAAPEAKIMPLRVLDSDGRGNVFEIAEAAEYAVNNGADVINMSLGSYRESELLSDLIESLGNEDDDGVLENVPEEGVVVVASAGNEGAPDRRHPAAGDEMEGEGVLAVTSVDAQERRSEFANFDDRAYGAPGSWIDVAAPGDDVHSLFPTSRYAEWDGTSMAAPFVAGQAALLRGLAPGVDAAGLGDPGCPSVERLIEESARSLDTQNPEYAGRLGAGHADADASLLALQSQAANCPPSNTAPEISAVRPAPGSATRDRTPLVVAAVSDAQTDLTKNNVSLYLDGRPRATFSYDANDDDRLVYSSGRLSYGPHTVRISATDPEGLTASKAWRFRVVRR